MAQTVAPGRTSVPSKTGVCDDVAVTMTSASRTASALLAAGTTRRGSAASISAANRRRAASSRPYTATSRSCGQAACIASSWVAARPPVPKSAPRSASGRASARRAAPAAAAVRSWVTQVPSSRAQRTPVAPSISRTWAWELGSPWARLPGKTSTTFRAAAPSPAQ